MLTLNRIARLTPEQLAEARGWLADCGFGRAYRMPTADVILTVEHEYDGGVIGFLSDCGL